MSKVYVITGANRGIGLALATELSSQGHKIIATARTPETATKLKALRNVSIVQAEMSDLKSLPRVIADIAALAPEGIDELWNVRYLKSWIFKESER
jgi:NAD(P)-dependent dehydrogenase (short-subunit alcohol dehydrogenase family)